MNVHPAPVETLDQVQAEDDGSDEEDGGDIQTTAMAMIAPPPSMIASSRKTATRHFTCGQRLYLLRRVQVKQQMARPRAGRQFPS